MERPRSFAPIIAAVLLLLPVLYVGSYLALVNPFFGSVDRGSNNGVEFRHGYRNGGEWAWRLYYPLEQMDRRVRPKAWEELALRKAEMQERIQRGRAYLNQATRRNIVSMPEQIDTPSPECSD